VKWFQDCVDTQNDKNGNISNGAPGYKPGGGDAQLDWSAAMMITPNAIWQSFGDAQPIFQHYDALRRYMTQWEKLIGQINDFEAKDKKGASPYKIIGDWVALEKGTTREFIGKVMGYIISKQMIDFATITKHTTDVATFTNLAAQYKASIIAKNIQPNGIVDANTQCAYAYVARYGLYNAEQKELIKQQFKNRIIADNYSVLTGFHGTGNLLQGLTTIGLVNEASKIITNEKSPSWGGMVKRGATTIWERWDGKDDDGNFFSPYMNSFNHYTFGGCGEWMMGFLVGLQVQEAGFKTIRVEPTIIPDLNWVSGSFQSPYGTISNKWERKDGKITMSTSIPSNTTALIVFPQNSKKIMLNNKSIVIPKTGLTIGSGNYQFSWQ
jgi:alpha-L-rhamnosidase